jgi:hypothetical protein
VSFTPMTRPPASRAARRAAAPNTLFFGDLAEMSTADLLGETCRALGMDGSAITAAHEHAAAQIVANSRIALWKFRLAAVSVYLAAAAVALPLPLLAVWWQRRFRV